MLIPSVRLTFCAAAKTTIHMKRGRTPLAVALAICSAGCAPTTMQQPVTSSAASPDNRDHGELICGSDPYFAERFPELCLKLAAIEAAADADTSPAGRRASAIRHEVEARMMPLERAKAEVREDERRCAAGLPQIGMTEAQAVNAWCHPDHVNTSFTAHGTDEQWVYPDRGYLYFENGRLVAIQRQS
jgi:hypothetical protein